MTRCFLIILLIVSNGLLAQQDHKIQHYLNKLEKDNDLKNASISFYAVSLKDGKIIAALNEYKSLTPASVTKLFTTASALSILGKNKTFKTQLCYTGTIDSNGVLNGNIYIVGGGDPTLGSPLFFKENPLQFITSWVEAIKNIGIKEIKGSIIADISLFDNNIPPGWAWGDIGNYYGAGANALSIYDNVYELEFDTRNTSKPVLKNIYPKLPDFVLYNELETSESKTDNSIIYGYPDLNERTIKGSIPANRKSFKVEGSIPTPDRVVVWLLKEELKKQNILFGNDVFASSATDDKKIIYENISPPLADIVEKTNIKSINSYAECLLNQIALTKYPKATNKLGIEVLYQFLNEKNLNTEGLFITDGSGLSRSNAIAAIHLVELLQFMYNDKNNFESFKKSLPVAGVSGSIANMCKGTVAEGKVFAKSGYMTRVRSYAGYVTTIKGEDIAFAVIVNNYNCTPAEMKAKLEKLFIALVEHH
jgi:D-alanyl-D-alanine carboxypeptidase/D-alanyl-D-alanine-endopeptidase (penicillin-binding protein 4)